MKYKNVEPQYLSFYPYYARHGQDKFLNENIFKNKKNGVFVDVGAYDGVESSNTLFFEESLGWSGICIEPLQDAFKKLKGNRNCVCINNCVADFTGKSEFMHVKPNVCPPSPREEGRTSNYEKMSGLTKFYNENHSKIIDDIIKEYGGSKNTSTVECLDVNDVLAMTNSKRIDLLSIDTEGSELCILTHVDFSKFDIDVIVIEVLYATEEILNFLESKNYRKVVEIGYDWIFKKT